MNCQRMKKECLTVPVQELPRENDKPRLEAEETSSSNSKPVPPIVQLRSSQSSSKVDDTPRVKLGHESSYDSLPSQRPHLAAYQSESFEDLVRGLEVDVSCRPYFTHALLLERP